MLAVGRVSVVVADALLPPADIQLMHSPSRTLQECSLGQSPAVCDDVLSCRDLDIFDCDIECLSSCWEANIEDSNLQCNLQNACLGSDARRSTVSCSNVTGSCHLARFFASAVDCAAESSCTGRQEENWYQCSCCTNPLYCPPGVPSCSPGNNATEFCNSTYLGKTCKDWGNPVCRDIEVVAPQPLKPADSCSADQDLVVCPSRNGLRCKDARFQNCTADCLDDCESAIFSDSKARCMENGSCLFASMTRSDVECAPNENSCLGVDFFASMVSCEGSDSCHGSIDDRWYRCTCCVSRANCPSGVPTCSDEFCAQDYLGRTCQDWGNPYCRDANVTSLEPLHPADTCSEGAEIKLCPDENGEGCRELEIEACTVECLDLCDATVFINSNVKCLQDSCFSAKMSQSNVSCAATSLSCNSVVFTASAVSCEGSDSCNSLSTFDICSCCDGIGCPADVLSCRNDVNQLCATIDPVTNMTCAESRNPRCPLPPTPEPSTSPSALPSALPSVSPSHSPSADPSTSPSSQPSDPPSLMPSQNPSSGTSEVLSTRIHVTTAYVLVLTLASSAIL